MCVFYHYYSDYNRSDACPSATFEISRGSATFRITGVVIFSYRWIFSVVNTLLLILHYLISYEYQPSRRKVRCLFQNLPHYSLPLKTDSASIRTAEIVEQSRHFSGNKMQETEIPFNTFLLYSLRLFCYMPYNFVSPYGAISPVVYFPTITLGSLLNSSLNPCTVSEIAKFTNGVPGVVVWSLRDRSNWPTLLRLPFQKTWRS